MDNVCWLLFFFFYQCEKKKKKVGSGFSCKAATVKRVFFFLCRSTPFQGLKWRSNKRRNDNIPLWLSALCAVERVYKERMKELRLAFSCFPFFFFFKCVSCSAYRRCALKLHVRTRVGSI